MTRSMLPVCFAIVLASSQAVAHHKPGHGGGGPPTEPPETLTCDDVFGAGMGCNCEFTKEIKATGGNPPEARYQMVGSCQTDATLTLRKVGADPNRTVLIGGGFTLTAVDGVIGSVITNDPSLDRAVVSDVAIEIATDLGGCMGNTAAISLLGSGIDEPAPFTDLNIARVVVDVLDDIYNGSVCHALVVRDSGPRNFTNYSTVMGEVFEDSAVYMENVKFFAVTSNTLIAAPTGSEAAMTFVNAEADDDGEAGLIGQNVTSGDFAVAIDVVASGDGPGGVGPVNPIGVSGNRLTGVYDGDPMGPGAGSIAIRCDAATVVDVGNNKIRKYDVGVDCP